MKPLLITISFFCCTLSSCSIFSLSGGNELNRFRSATVVAAKKDEKYVDVYLFSTKSETDVSSTSSSKTLWDLQSDGQAAYINQSANAAVDKDKLIEAMNQQFLKDEADEIADYTKKSVRIILSVAKNRDYGNQFIHYTPADRIEYFKMKLSIIPDSVSTFPKFIKWNRFETKFDTIKIADVSFERTIDTKLSLKAGNETSENSAGADIGSTNKRTVAQSIRYRTVSLNGALHPKYLQLEEEGNREIDLNDNIILDVTIEFEKNPDHAVTLKNLFDDKGQPNTPDKTLIKINNFYIPDYAESTPLNATIDFDYLFRHVLNKNLKTFPEYDDRISLIKGSGQTQHVPLLSADDIKPKRWKIIKTATNDVLHFFNANVSAKDIQFLSYAAASDFVRWLKSYSTPADTDVLKIGDMNFSIGTDSSTALTKKHFNDNSLSVRIMPF